MDGRRNNKGTKGNKGGRPSKKDEEKQSYIFTQALKRLTNEDEEDEAKICFLMDFAQETVGRKFIAEHVFGKPKEISENTILGDSKPIIVLGKKPD